MFVISDVIVERYYYNDTVYYDPVTNAFTSLLPSLFLIFLMTSLTPCYDDVTYLLMMSLTPSYDVTNALL